MRFIFALSLHAIFLLIVVSGCENSKSNLVQNLVAKQQGKFIMYIISVSDDDDYEYEVIKIFNLESNLLKAIEEVRIHKTAEEKAMWRKLGIEEFPAVVILDTKKIVFQTTKPEKLMEFAKQLNEE